MYTVWLEIFGGIKFGNLVGNLPIWQIKILAKIFLLNDLYAQQRSRCDLDIITCAFEVCHSKMYSLHKYFKQASLTPSSTSVYSFLTERNVESANENVETALAEKPATTRRVGLKYNA